MIFDVTSIPEQLTLEISLSSQTLELQGFSTSGARWRGRLNQMCLDAFLLWLREEVENARVWTQTAALPSFWEFVNGTAIACEEIRLVLIPTTAIDTDELRVPQEWVDIPDWVADYYIAVQVNPNGGWVTICGYTTHRQLKTKGVYDASDRAYCLDENDLIKDINGLWITRQLCPEEILRESVAPLPTLPLAQAENLLERLGNSEVVFPRLAIPFELWGALLTHGGWRQGLYERRQGLPEQWSIQEWLQAGVSNLAQQLGWGMTRLQLAARGLRSRETDESSVSLSRQLTLAGQAYELRVFQRGNLEDNIWRFELRNANPDAMIPAGFRLRLLTEDLQPFVNNEDTATEAISQLYIDVELEPGEGLVWEIEPTPDDYDREILRF
ncbi:DUF1822 family protein (plasmid) [Anabaena sp. FACHB-709]|uniref:DUF1822 family protein n=1 Tax=Anabaena cylindrica FACHB-318 TaxID=2692880 RepID=A0ABR7ZRF0_ANACY|nr:MULTISPECIES: DUF1822 family protein [Nostocaceae]MBD2175113.1 DUF1822 family protein [Anabaena cylindrica FACHB-318]MBD2267020.1 DUF1822 family protein [Anabaena sp. FACHB-709]MBD2276570.1 DUF1822 family protein [Nostoc sp. PCC 7120 = FACHB-418]MBD2287092.1 DUF1822 family protein [Anabaena cylindrica FACHB-170]RUR73133.1 hypothetical protein DSM107007_54920 [Nostoc sp. PCC 7120 = FACHB-418]